jgi:tetratricopeptide (TPR) repeat protein
MKLLFVCLSLLLSTASFSQQQDLASALDEAIGLHDKGEYDKALAIYDSIIAANENYYLAWHEKTLTLYALKRYKDCIATCEQVIKKFPDNTQNAQLYSNWGSATDDMGDYKEAIKIYGKGIKKFPDAFLLYLNKGITEYKHQLLTDATEDMKKAVTLNPLRASCHQFLAFSIYDQNKMAAALSLSTFLLLEPEGPRAVKNLESLLNIFGSNVQKKDEKNITITLSPSALPSKKKSVPDDFSMQEMTISFQSALDYDDKNKNQNVAEKLKSKLEVFSVALGDKDSKGFFTATYIPFFKRLSADSLLETASYYMYASSEDENVKQWLQSNPDKVQSLRDWIKAYQWRKD